MFLVRRLLVLACALTLSTAFVATSSASASSTQSGGATKKKGKGKPCKKGYKRKTVTRKGKQVKVCIKVKPAPGPKPGAAAPAPTPPSPPAQGLFPDPGRTLEEAEAKEYLKPYLPNSTFTDCVTGWPSCGGFENRYSHSAGSTFYKCWLRPTSGSDVKSVGEYGVNKARVNPDGSWVIQEIVSWYGYHSLFEWEVSDSGVVNGASQSDSGGAPEKIGPLQYVGGVAKDCSY